MKVMKHSMEFRSSIWYIAWSSKLSTLALHNNVKVPHTTTMSDPRATDSRAAYSFGRRKQLHPKCTNNKREEADDCPSWKLQATH